MLLAWIVFILIVLYSLYDTRKAIILWMPVRLLFNAQIALRYTTPAMSLDIGVMLWLLLLYMVKCYGKENTYHLNKEKGFITPIFLAFLLSFCVSFPFSINFSMPVITKTIKFFVMSFGYVFIFQKALNTAKDIRYFLMTTGIVILLIILLGIYQFITKDNPFLDYVYMNSPHDDTTEGRMYYSPPWVVDEYRLRYGMIRCCSFFSFHVPFGTACVMLLFLVGFLMKNRILTFSKIYLNVAMILLCVGVVISNTKQAYVGLVVLFFCFFKIQDIFNWHILILLVTLVIIGIYMPELYNNYISLFDQDLAEEGGGSTVAMRQEQYAVAFKMFGMNPIFGNGPFSLGTLKYLRVDFGDIRGAESVFLSILPERGLIGVIVYLFMYYVLYTRLKKSMPHYQLIFFLLTYFVMEVAGGSKDLTLFLGILIVCNRIIQMKKLDEFILSPNK